jgi:hypothetical protein
MRTSDAVDKIFAALADAQAATEAATKDNTNPAFRSKYADLTSHVEVIRPAAKAHKLAVLQELTSDDNGVHVTTRIAHASGQWVEFGPLFIPANKHDAQGFGSAASYARRYALSAAWGTVADDDDGNAAVASTPKKPAIKSIVPEGYDDWLTELQAFASTCDSIERFRENYGASKPEHRKYLEINNRGALDAMVSRFQPKKVA